MPHYRQHLPQLDGGLFLTDGGIETTLIFHEKLDLPLFAAFTLLKTPDGTAVLRRYFDGYAGLAFRTGTGLVLESATWRANPDWAGRLGYSPSELAAANRQAISLLEAIRSIAPASAEPIVVSGCVGPRGDGYVAGDAMSTIEAQRYHQAQVDTFAGTTADMICAHTMTYAAEAVGIARAAQHAGMPVAISFTVETDGRLPNGQTLQRAIEEVDDRTSGYPAYFMINCAHTTHFAPVLEPGQAWVSRLRGLRANASRMSHAELNESPTLDAGNPEQCGLEYAWLVRRLPNLNVLGGCCGTDLRHVEQIARSCAGLFAVAAAR